MSLAEADRAVSARPWPGSVAKASIVAPAIERMGWWHLLDRVADRQIPTEDLYELKLWRESEPEAPAGPWYKDFGSFKICGEGELPTRFLLKGQAAKGKAL